MKKENTDSIPLELNQEPTKEQSEADNQNLEDDIKPVDDTQIGDTIIEESVNDENTTEDTTTSEEGQTSDNTDETIIETETTEN